MGSANGYEDLGVECALPRGYSPARSASASAIRLASRYLLRWLARHVWLVALAAVALTLLLAWPEAAAWTEMLANLSQAMPRS